MGGELDYWSDSYGNKKDGYDNLAYQVLRKRGLRPAKRGGLYGYFGFGLNAP
jgi:hypothetical protein